MRKRPSRSKKPEAIIEHGYAKAVEQNNIKALLDERGKRYGEFKEHARITQAIKRAMRDSPNWEELPDEMKEALEMDAHKKGRILNGDFRYADSWVDTVGYNQLIVDEL